MLDPTEVVQDPAMQDSSPSYNSPQRVCETCFDETNARTSIPSRLQGSSSSSMERIVIDEGRLAVPRDSRRDETSSQISDLAEWVIADY